MTGTKSGRAKFANFFDYFYKYWNYTSKRGTEYTELEVTFQTSFIYMLIKNGVGRVRLGYRRVEMDLSCLGQ